MTDGQDGHRCQTAVARGGQSAVAGRGRSIRQPSEAEYALDKAFFAYYEPHVSR